MVYPNFLSTNFDSKLYENFAYFLSIFFEQLVHFEFTKYQSIVFELWDKLINSRDHNFFKGLAEWSVPKAGMFLWIKVTGIESALELAMHKLAPVGVLVIPGNAFAWDTDKLSQHLRLSYSFVSADEVDKVSNEKRDQSFTVQDNNLHFFRGKNWSSFYTLDLIFAGSFDYIKNDQRRSSVKEVDQ